MNVTAVTSGLANGDGCVFVVVLSIELLCALCDERESIRSVDVGIPDKFCLLLEQIPLNGKGRVLTLPPCPLPLPSSLLLSLINVI